MGPHRSCCSLEKVVQGCFQSLSLSRFLSLPSTLSLSLSLSLRMTQFITALFIFCYCIILKPGRLYIFLILMASHCFFSLWQAQNLFQPILSEHPEHNLGCVNVQKRNPFSNAPLAHIITDAATAALSPVLLQCLLSLSLSSSPVIY